VAKVYDEIGEKLGAWIGAQSLFFVGTAPLGANGHVNVSPKGDLKWFRILGPRQVAYLDFIGSGAETISHLQENGRIVLMFCAFEGPPKIVRLHGSGEVLLPRHDGFEEALAAFDPPEHALRSLIRVDVDRVSDSCGFGVPLMSFGGRRPQYADWVAHTMRTSSLDTYVAEENAESIDGLPAVRSS
jgi:hypothetical protein